MISRPRLATFGRVPTLAAAGTCALLLAAACAGPAAEEAAPREYESALLERLVQLADDELGDAGAEAGPYCAARIDAVPATSSRDPADAVLSPATAAGRQVRPVSECGSFERPAVDGAPATMVMLLPVADDATDSVRGGYRLPTGVERFYSCPVVGEESGVRLGVCEPSTPR